MLFYREQPVYCIHLRSLPFNRLVAERKAAQTGFGAGTTDAHHGFIVGAHERQHTAGRHAAQHHAADHRAGVARQRRHVQHVVALRVGLDHRRQLGIVPAAVAQLHALGGGERPCRRRNHRRAVGHAHAIADLAHGFQQLARHQQIELARQRREPEHRAPPAQRTVRLWPELKVVRGGTGALRHARNRGGLRRMTRLARHGRQPLGQHASAFAAQRAHQHRDGLRRADHARASAGCSARTSAPRSV